MYHTLLAGLSEFGDIEGLTWTDESLHAYVQKRHAVEPLTPEFDAAARQELETVLRQHPWLPLRVAARRVAEFLVAWRPARYGHPVLLAVFLAFKLAVLVGAFTAYRWCQRSGRGPLFLWALAVVLAPVLAHALIVPLLEVYIAATLVLITPLGMVGAAFVAWRLLRLFGVDPCASRREEAPLQPSAVARETPRQQREQPAPMHSPEG
jgi:hypothetical protein